MKKVMESLGCYYAEVVYKGRNEPGRNHKNAIIEMKFKDRPDAVAVAKEILEASLNENKSVKSLYDKKYIVDIYISPIVVRTFMKWLSAPAGTRMDKIGSHVRWEKEFMGN